MKAALAASAETQGQKPELGAQQAGMPGPGVHWQTAAVPASVAARSERPAEVALAVPEPVERELPVSAHCRN
jgi:hypothetical protein